MLWPPPLASSPFSLTIAAACLGSLPPAITHSAPEGTFQPTYSVPTLLCRRCVAPASGPVLGLLLSSLAPAACRGLPHALTCECWLLGEPQLLPASCVASAALPCHRSPAFLGHLSVTPRRQGVLSPEAWTPVPIQTPQGLLHDMPAHHAQVQSTICKKQPLYGCFLTRRMGVKKGDPGSSPGLL